MSKGKHASRICQNKKSMQEVISLGPEHIKACLELDNIALGGLWTKEQWHKELIDPRRLCLGMFKLSKLIAVGCGWLILDELHLTAIAVHPQFRRNGYACYLLTTLMKHAYISGSTRATLEVNNTNIAAKALYKSCGFQTAGCRSRYYKDGSDAIIQWCTLNYEETGL